MSMTPNFLLFMQLPREIRDYIYSYTLIDEIQGNAQSHIYAHSLLRKRQYDKRGWTLVRELSEPSQGALPKIQTPGILRLDKQT